MSVRPSVHTPRRARLGPTLDRHVLELPEIAPAVIEHVARRRTD